MIVDICLRMLTLDEFYGAPGFPASYLIDRRGRALPDSPARADQVAQGVRQVRYFKEAATRYIFERRDQPSIKLTALCLRQLNPYIGELPLTYIDDQALEPFIKDRQTDRVLPDGKVVSAVSNRIVNIAIERVIRVCRCAPGSGETKSVGLGWTVCHC